jgi:MFS family permease
LFAGHVADTMNRKRIILFTVFAYLTGAVSLLILSLHLKNAVPNSSIISIYSIIFATGIARGFLHPAQSAVMAQIVPRNLYPNSSTWNSTIWHIAAVSGPALGGLIYGFTGIVAAYSTVVGFVFLSLIFFARIKNRPLPVSEKKEGLFKSLSAGIRFVFGNQILLSAMALDMFAVLFGGAVAMLPVFAAEVLNAGPQGLGFLRAAPAAGAVLMALVLAFHPPLRHAGVNLLIAVAGFGCSIILFAISRNFYFSLGMLLLSGMFDNVSVIIRSTIIQLYTPDQMRGRVASVNSIFIGSSNEIGSFESGLAARLLGLVPSVIFGGTMTLLIAAGTGRFSPKLRKLNLHEVH